MVIVGPGRLGGALGRSLAQAGWPVRLLSRSAGGRRRIRAWGLAPAQPEDVTAARAVLLCVPDSAVADAAAHVTPLLGRRTALLHCAGALSLQALGDAAGRERGSFHPLCAVSDARDALAGHAVALSSTSPGLRRLLRRMARDVGLSPVLDVPESRRAAYHAGAVLSAGGLVGLASAAVEALARAGLSEDEALGALLPLMRSALRGVEARGLARGLTGPVARGDAGVVAAHLAALPRSVQDVYRPLALRGVRLVKARLPPSALRTLTGVLRRG